jgi:Fic family protein
MVYIYRKRIGTKDYFYLRASIRKNNKTLTKDISYLGNDVNTIREKLKTLPQKYHDEIKKTYKTISRFIDVNHYLEKVKELKLKKDEFISNENLLSVEACKLHWQNEFKNQDSLTKDEKIKYFIIDFSFNTTSIEGNTITLKEAQNLLLENLTPKDKPLRDVYDVQNTEKVFLKLINDSNEEISHELICRIHDSLLENIDSRKGYRTMDVKVLRSNFKASPAPYDKIDMDILLNWYNDNKDRLHPIVLATLFHHKFEKIHPFMDGNGRTGRMLLNFILLKKGYPPCIIRKKNRLISYMPYLNNADKCDLNKSNVDDYKPIVNFITKEMNVTYWNIFL